MSLINVSKSSDSLYFHENMENCMQSRYFPNFSSVRGMRQGFPDTIEEDLGALVDRKSLCVVPGSEAQ